MSLFLDFLQFFFFPFNGFKVNRQKEAACHRCFVYSDKIAAFIVRQINLKNRRRAEREGAAFQWTTDGWEKKRERKKNNTPIVASSCLVCFYLSMTNSSVQCLLFSFLHIFSFSPYLLSQHCITCHFRIMSSHVYNDIAFVPQITLGFSPPPPPQNPTHIDEGIKMQLHADPQTCKCQKRFIHKPWKRLGESKCINSRNILKGVKQQYIKMFFFFKLHCIKVEFSFVCFRNTAWCLLTTALIGSVLI